MRSLIAALPALGVVVFLGLAMPAHGQSSLLHEFIPPDPNEDVSVGATTLDGNFPAALDTPSGPAAAPDPRKPPDPNNLYAADDSSDSTYEPDRDTRQPNIENYDDPFSPSTSPFKRLRAYDSVDADYTLKVGVKATSLLSVGGEAGPDDEPFYGDFSVELVPDELVRIPSVGPGARVLKMHVSPTATVSLLRDGAENWFIRGTERKRVRVVMHLAIARATFGSEFRDPSWESLERHIPDFSHHDAQAQKVFDTIGVSRSMRPKEALSKLVAYYRAFQPSDDPPKIHNDIFLDLALSKKGVCRHRAFAFLITAIQLGLPARMVVNEAHAWVEVFDSVLWHRIDLGGAALNLDESSDPSRPQHQPPNDPFEWPDGARNNSGGALADRTNNGGGTSDPGEPDPNGPSATDPDPGSDPGPGPANNDLPPSKLEVELVDKAIRRGATLKIKGTVSGKDPCKNVRVDVRIKNAENENGRAIGSLSTDDDGKFEGSVVVPRDVATGDYELYVVTRGDKTCGAGRSE